MIRRYALLIVGVVTLSALAWWYVGDDESEEPAPRPSSPVETLTPEPPDAPDVSVPPELPSQQAPQIIERERITERDNDDDDAPDVRVVVPSSSPAPQPTAPAPAQTTRPPIVQPIEIPELPDVPDVPLPDLPIPLLP